MIAVRDNRNGPNIGIVGADRSMYDMPHLEQAEALVARAATLGARMAHRGWYMAKATPGMLSRRASDCAALAQLFTRDERLFLPGSAAEVPALMDAICAGAAPPLALTGGLIPGVNASPIGRLPEGTHYSGIFSLPAPPGAQAAGAMRHLPMSYGQFASRLSGMTFDTLVVQVSPPDARGFCSFGPTVELLPIVMRRARRIFAVINPHVPPMPRSADFKLADAQAWCESDAPLTAYDVGAPSAQAQTIAASIARFIDDGTTVQIGLGKVPDALLAHITDRRNIRLFSGMLSDGARLLAEAGSLDADFDHCCCVHVGTAEYYDWLRANPLFAVRDCTYTHGPAQLAQLTRFVAVNSALSVDLSGQANLEMLNGRMISGVGGAADYARAAAECADGVSIIALPATSGREGVSRIVPMLDGPVSIPRHDVDVVITEHGIADLRGCGAAERGERLIAIAAPDHRASLADAFRTTMARL